MLCFPIMENSISKLSEIGLCNLNFILLFSYVIFVARISAFADRPYVITFLLSNLEISF